MLAAAVALILACRISDPTLVAVDRVELNTHGQSEDSPVQLILWRWTSFGGKSGFRVSQWWLVKRPIVPQYQSGRYVIEDRGVRIVTKSFSVTRTKIDPEIRDRGILPEHLRVPYFPNMLPSYLE